MKKKNIEKLLDFSLMLVDECSKISLKYYKKTIKPEYKKDNSPVTIADKKCEAFLISSIRKKYPEHSFLAEESGLADRDSDFKWIIDPIDGTKNFMRNFPFWGTLLALEYQGEVVMGIIALPAMKKVIYAGKGLGCFQNGKKIKVSKISSLEKSYFIYGGIEFITKQPYKERFLQLVDRSYYDRGYGDCFGHSLVVEGKAEFMLDPHVSPYDVAPIKICVEEAGGIMTDLNGEKTIYSRGVLTSNGFMHEEILKFLKG
ncbi:MAG: histidinol phosphate phosphatase [Bacteroidetes bacterium]|nr:histidinol phosphate phosphatase [Bacteroidota bacterium]